MTPVSQLILVQNDNSQTADGYVHKPIVSNGLLCAKETTKLDALRSITC